MGAWLMGESTVPYFRVYLWAWRRVRVESPPGKRPVAVACFHSRYFVTTNHVSCSYNIFSSRIIWLKIVTCVVSNASDWLTLAVAQNKPVRTYVSTEQIGIWLTTYITYHMIQLVRLGAWRKDGGCSNGPRKRNTFNKLMWYPSHNCPSMLHRVLSVVVQ